MPWPKEVHYERYPSDLLDEEWQLIKPIFEEVEPYTTGRPRTEDLREIVNAIFYLNKTGCPWRYLPKDFPSYKLVSYYYQKWVNNGTWEQVNTILHRRLRKEAGRKEEPTAGIMDSQTVRGTPESVKEVGIDGGKKIKGRKRHIVVDTMGYPIFVVVHAANIHDSRGAKRVLDALGSIVKTIQKIWVDTAYQGEELAQWAKEKLGCFFEVVKKKEGKGFQVVSWRWIVERTFGWFGRYRRLNRDYERKPESSKSQVYVASIRLMLRRIMKERNKKAAHGFSLLPSISTAAA